MSFDKKSMFNNNNIFDSKFKRKMSIRRKEKDAVNVAKLIGA